MKHPPALAPGDTVALLSPASPSPSEAIDATIELIEGWGLRVRLGAHARDRHPRYEYLAGTDADRAADLLEAWCDPAVAGIVCLRGGYGSIRVLEHLDADAMRAAEPKRLMGSSDITCLHEFLSEELAVASWFTVMPGTRPGREDAVAVDGLRRALFEDAARWSLSAEDPRPIVPGTATGRLVGGNLSLLAMTAARRRGFTEPVVLALEDVDEDAYRLDGYLQVLRRAGLLAGVVGVASGSWLSCGPGAQIDALLAETFAPLGVATGGGFAFGHGPGARALPLGAQVRLDVPAAGVSRMSAAP